MSMMAAFHPNLKFPRLLPADLPGIVRTCQILSLNVELIPYLSLSVLTDRNT